jgi:uncharacterized Zn-binding protein involved in type VI secretion
MPLAARVLDAVSHPIPPVLTGGPGSPVVFIGGRPAWRALPTALGAAVESASSAVAALMSAPILTPLETIALLEAVSTTLRAAADQAAAQGCAVAVSAAAIGLEALDRTNEILTLAWTTASAAPGGLPAASQAYAEGIQAAAAAAATAVFIAIGSSFDMHACAVSPHGPGLVTAGSTRVMANGLPLARVGDTVAEAAGGANPIVGGCPIVNVG